MSTKIIDTCTINNYAVTLTESDGAPPFTVHVVNTQAADFVSDLQDFWSIDDAATYYIARRQTLRAGGRYGP